MDTKNNPMQSQVYVRTPPLRFIERDGKRILQSHLKWETADRTASGFEWYDVPLVKDP